MVGLAVGFAFIAFCVGTLGIGCLVVAVAIAALVGSAVAAATYWGVTSILGTTLGVDETEKEFLNDLFEAKHKYVTTRPYWNELQAKPKLY